MAKLRYGQLSQVSFQSQEEFYYALGFLANSNNAELRWENNEDAGAWGSEGRIHCLVPEQKFPQCFGFTAGRGAIYARINCNEYVDALINEHNFSYNGQSQNVERILETVPEKYRVAFKQGYGIKITIDPEYKPVIRRRGTSSSHNNHSAQTEDRANITTQPKAERKPPIQVPIGTSVFHITHGEGVVYELEKHYIRVRFSSDGEKSYINPDAFDKGYLTIINT